MKKLTHTFLTVLASGLLAIPAMAQKYPGLAKTPQMGWNSWNKFADKVNEDLIKETADALVRTGLRDAGYVYLNIDDCWHGERDSLGFIQSHPERFSLGIKVLSDYCHNRGLKLGIYSDAGRQTCGGRPGSFGHEYQDALQYANWGVDYLKYDWCNTEDINPRGAYRLMSEALKATGRPILFSMCEWGDCKGYEWGEPLAHSWRTTGDIWAHFDGLLEHGSWHANGVMQIIDINANLRKYAGPDHWNDPDMLEVGNGMSVNEDRAHFTMWCMMAAPLILGNDLNNMSQDVLDILTNRDVIAIDQDTLGIQGMRIEQNDSVEVWLKPLAGDDWAFCLLNRSITPKEVTMDWERWNTFDDEVSGREISFTLTNYQWRNLWWTGKKPQVGETRSKKKQTVTVPGHDVLLYRLTPKK